MRTISAWPMLDATCSAGSTPSTLAVKLYSDGFPSHISPRMTLHVVESTHNHGFLSSLRHARETSIFPSNNPRCSGGQFLTSSATSPTLTDSELEKGFFDLHVAPRIAILFVLAR